MRERKKLGKERRKEEGGKKSCFFSKVWHKREMRKERFSLHEAGSLPFLYWYLQHCVWHLARA